jgi:toxin CcdB
MKQFDVFPNPVTGARRAYPLVVVLQSDVAQPGRERAVAPLAPRSAFPEIAGRLNPVVRVQRKKHVLLVTSLTTLPARSLRDPVATLADRRDDILAAVDYLFFGV